MIGKKSIVLLLFMVAFTAQFSFGQNFFYVLKVIGKIENVSTGSVLKAGDKIDNTHKIKFASKTAKAMVMSKEAGKFVLDGQKAQMKDGELLAFVNNMNPLKKTVLQLSSKGENGKALNNLKDYFINNGNKTFYIIGDTLWLPIDTKTFPQSRSKYFTFNFKQNGKKVKKKIPYFNGQLMFAKANLFQYKGEYYKPNEVKNVKIDYPNKDGNNFSITLRFVGKDVLLEEVNGMVEFLSDNDYEDKEIKKEITQYIADIYGTVDFDYLFKLLDEEEIFSYSEEED